MDDRTRMIPTVKKERRRRRLKKLTEWGVDLIVVGLITFIAGFVCGVAWMSVR